MCRRTSAFRCQGEHFKFVSVDSVRGKEGKQFDASELRLYQFSLVTLLASLLLVPKRRKNTRLQHFGFGRNPVFERSAFFLSPFLVDLIRAQAYLSFQ